MNKKYIVRLEREERQQLEALVRKGKAAAYKIKHANILLTVDADGPNWSDDEAAEAFGCHRNTVRNVRQRFVEEGFEAALERKKQANPPRERKLDGKGEARLIALACSKPPKGRSRWTLKLLADALVALEIVDSICDQTVRRTLKKTNCVLTGENAG
jgi:transposase